MSAPPAGYVRVLPGVNLPGGLRAGVWADVPAHHRLLADWIDAGLVSLTGPGGTDPPVDLPRPVCCGRG